MLQEVFRIPFLNIPVFGYGLMLVVAFLAFIQISQFLARRSNINPENFVNGTFIGLVIGVIGSRLSHVLENWHEYADPRFSLGHNLLHMINVREGGLTFYGGFLLATPICIAYAVHKKMPLRRSMDIVAIGLMVGLGIGRVGCFLNGCCYGERCDASWGVQFPYHSPAYLEQLDKGELQAPDTLFIPNPDLRGTHLATKDDLRHLPELKPVAAEQKALPVLPTELYSTFNSLLLAAVLFAFYTLKPAPGRVFALMCLLEGTTRFLLEMVRVEPPLKPEWFGPLSIAQVTSIAVVVAGVILWFTFPHFGTQDPLRAPGGRGFPATVTA
jgi:phosphatidylglycerol:prolipoprotein diacylglycerol transferase